ncbi:winged helix DNA-binding domain-containing protein [Schumannella sp. 10F1B-5-1]|uniref:winged helix DNA-binding domain-containing protein n=1 Tax=Schumannella sp. 10F1B-5-1 TaxID=2590780 RepID=UPI0015E83379|nr:winged helix DNA-binding domain-containing protein [Schumannella sp. 10F1B-5-1]
MSLTSDRRRIAQLRETALGLGSPRPATASAAVGDLLAMQAQDLPGALWSIGVRTGLTADEVRAAHEAGDLVRSWPMRGTLHLLRPADLRWMLALTGERQHRSAAARHRDLGLDEAQFARAAEIARAELEGGGRLDRADLLAAFVAGGVPIDGQRGAHLIGALAHRVAIVLTGPSEFACADDVLPAADPLDRDTALARLAELYLAGHGPADERDLAWWAGIPLGDARRGIAAAREHPESVELEEIAIGERRLLARVGLEPAASTLRLLPGFDELLLGYTDRTATLHELPLEAVVPGRNGMFLPTVVIDGRVVATWKRTATARRVRVAVSVLTSIPSSKRAALERAARGYVEHLGRPADQLELTAVDGG